MGKKSNYPQLRDDPGFVVDQQSAMTVDNDLKQLEQELASLNQMGVDNTDQVNAAAADYLAGGDVATLTDIAATTETKRQELLNKKTVLETARLVARKRFNETRKTITKRLLKQRQPERTRLAADVAKAYKRLADALENRRNYEQGLAHDGLTPGSGSAGSLFAEITNLRQRASAIERQAKL